MRCSIVLALLPVLVGIGSCGSQKLGGIDGSGGGAVGSGGSAVGGGGAGGQSGQGGADEIATIMATYTTWQPQSAMAVDISAEIFSLCRGPSAAEGAFTKSVHSRFRLRDWANPGAMAGLAAKGVGGFPVGAIIVKEKFVSPAPTDPFVVAALGMMIKRSPGFHPAGGDWEFVYSSMADGVSRGPAQLSSCTTCHAATTATDYVFVDDRWRISM